MGLKIDHLAGFVLGVGVTAFALAVYAKNRGGLAALTRRLGGKPTKTADTDYEDKSLDELVREKEHLEEMIADRELAAEAGE
jgi:hypothetical protein